ncbi:hypothetical protein Droror1_Dr00025221 [Drosera rotundifolia]
MSHSTLGIQTQERNMIPQFSFFQVTPIYEFQHLTFSSSYSFKYAENFNPHFNQLACYTANIAASMHSNFLFHYSSNARQTSSMTQLRTELPLNHIHSLA